MSALSRCLLLMLFALALAACPAGGGGDDDDASTSLCNGERDLGEFATDDTYDLDGDGYFDASDPGCEAYYPVEELDCDDNNALVHPGQDEISCNEADDDCNPSTEDDMDLDLDGSSVCDGDCNDESQAVHPGATEIECNGIDEDCDGYDSGAGCTLDYSGAWTLTSAVTMDCPLLSIDFSAFVLTQSGETVEITPDSCASCNGPGVLAGTFTGENQASVSNSDALTGNCQVDYSMLATFVTENSVSGSLVGNFIGADCGGEGCQGFNVAFEGARD